MPLPQVPSFGGYQLVEPLVATQDGQVWAGRREGDGVYGAIALLAKDALVDPGAVWRLRQELAKVPAAAILPLLTLDPPQRAEDATNLRRMPNVPRGFIPAPTTGTTLPPPSAPPPRPEADRKKERKIVFLILGILGALSILCIAAYVAFIVYILGPLLQWDNQQTNVRETNSHLVDLNDAVDEWARDNSIPTGTVYTWQEISDYVPYYIQDKATSKGPIDPLGHPYTLAPVGSKVTLHPDSRAIVDDKDPDFFWDKD